MLCFVLIFVLTLSARSVMLYSFWRGREVMKKVIREFYFVLMMLSMLALCFVPFYVPHGLSVADDVEKYVACLLWLWFVSTICYARRA